MRDRDEMDKYRGDVWYEEWRRGLPEGSISDDRITDAFYAGQDPDCLVEAEASRRAARRAERLQEQEYPEQEYDEP